MSAASSSEHATRGGDRATSPHDEPRATDSLGGMSVEAWNDQLAREHDIEKYYSQSSVLIRMVERRRLRLVESLLAAEPGEYLLEVGCGAGHVLARFPRCRLVGVDVSGEMLAKARARLDGLDVALLKGELETVGLAPSSFDAAVCTEVLEHVLDPVHLLDEIHALLKPSGRAVVTFPNDALIKSVKRFTRETGLRLLPGLRRIDWGGDDYHLHQWTVAQMRSLLERRFVIEQEAFAPFRGVAVRCCFLVRPS